MSTEACLLHGAVLLASLQRGRVYPLNGPAGSAITVYTRAKTLLPFDFLSRPVVAEIASMGGSFTGGAASTCPGAACQAPRFRGGQEVSGDLDSDVSAPAAPCADTEADQPRIGWRPDRAHHGCSQPGNARSARWIESTVSTAMGDA